MLLGAVLLTTSDAVSKALTERYPVGELIFLRGLFVMVPVLWIVRARGGVAAEGPSRAVNAVRARFYRNVYDRAVPPAIFRFGILLRVKFLDGINGQDGI